VDLPGWQSQADTMRGCEMALDARLGSVVIFVHELDRSVDFYTQVLGLDVADRDATAALLVTASGSQLILRAMGGNAPHPLGAIGVQYIVWTAASADDLKRIEQVLRDRHAFTEIRSGEGVTALEGRDPDDMVVMVTYPGPDQASHRLPLRIYGW
jgi:catechol 2,3-dioxygenase-like lactoylglutathione lyase family enzyme